MVGYNENLDLKYSMSKIHTINESTCSSLSSNVNIRDTFSLKVRYSFTVCALSHSNAPCTLYIQGTHTVNTHTDIHGWQALRISWYCAKMSPEVT